MFPNMSKDEQDLIDFLEQRRGRKLTEQEIFVSLEQAAALGLITRETRH
jgi:hypothetical protein